jgi:hypothetical protein
VEVFDATAGASAAGSVDASWGAALGSGFADASGVSASLAEGLDAGAGGASDWAAAEGFGWLLSDCTLLAGIAEDVDKLASVEGVRRPRV